MLQDNDLNNIAETLAREMKAPVSLERELYALSEVLLPPGWSHKTIDYEDKLAAPLRKRATPVFTDVDSFINYCSLHGDALRSTVFCSADYIKGTASFQAILDDHGPSEDAPRWREHRASYQPVFSREWTTWIAKNADPMTQVNFATFIEDNMKDIVSAEGTATGAQMLEMALNFEARQDMRFKSSTRLQSGAVEMVFVQSDDDQTVTKMQMFERFCIGIPVYWGGDAYRIDARLRYRVRDGKLTFWYELIRADKTMEAATNTVIEKIRSKTGLMFYFGRP